MKPLIRWAGGKVRFLKIFEEVIQKNNFKFKRIIEPFAGSAAFSLNFENVEKYVINDLNPDLINFYTHVKINNLKLLKAIHNLYKANTTKESYYLVRDKFNLAKNQKRQTIIHAARFYYLNRFCFNGIFRVNRKGKFNVPIGSNKRHKPSQKEFEEAKAFLDKVELFSLNYIDVLKKTTKDDLIYFDPPYYPGESSQYTSYTDPQFREKENEELILKAWEFKQKNINVLISNSYNKKLIDFIKKHTGFRIQIIYSKRNINPNSQNKDKFQEILIY